jgi:hypothetical protein
MNEVVWLSKARHSVDSQGYGDTANSVRRVPNTIGTQHFRRGERIWKKVGDFASGFSVRNDYQYVRLA